MKRLGREHGCYVVNVDGAEDIHTRAVVLATGAHYNRLEVPGMDLLEPSSVYYAATTERRTFRGDPVVVVGGGNSAGQASLFLARSAASVTLVVRGDRLEDDMSRYLADRLTRRKGWRYDCIRWSRSFSDPRAWKASW